MKLGRRLAVLLALMAPAAPTRAEMITYTFQGTDTFVNGHFPVSGSLTYDTQAALLSPSNSGTPSTTFSTTGGIAITQDNHTFSTDPSTPLVVTLTGSSVTFSSQAPGVLNISLKVGDGTSTLFPSITALPGTLSLDGTTGSYDLWARVGDPDFLSRGVLDSLTASVGIADIPPTAPEPGSLALLATGLAGLGMAALRRRNLAP
jgi:hypothetical protein